MSTAEDTFQEKQLHLQKFLGLALRNLRSEAKI